MIEDYSISRCSIDNYNYADYSNGSQIKGTERNVCIFYDQLPLEANNVSQCSLALRRSSLTLLKAVIVGVVEDEVDGLMIATGVIDEDVGVELVGLVGEDIDPMVEPKLEPLIESVGGQQPHIPV
uniref:Uncharacterized protein n=1 Tax=Tetranychus urticae TaxID=32264 RepID=A0A158P553_TETUR